VCCGTNTRNKNVRSPGACRGTQNAPTAAPLGSVWPWVRAREVSRSFDKKQTKKFLLAPTPHPPSTTHLSPCGVCFFLLFSAKLRGRLGSPVVGAGRRVAVGVGRYWGSLGEINISVLEKGWRAKVRVFCNKTSVLLALASQKRPNRCAPGLGVAVGTCARSFAEF
jgi:hypothetical protein